MSLAAVIAIGLGFVLSAYAILAGGDFGAGILDLAAGKSWQRAPRSRARSDPCGRQTTSG